MPRYGWGAVDDLEDRDLLQRAKEGDQDAGWYLVNRYRAMVFKNCNMVISDRNLAEDVAETALHNAFFKLGMCEEKFRPWLCRLARNLALDEVKSAEYR